VFEPHPGEPRHHVELGRPRVAEFDGEGLEPAVDDVEVLAAEPLGDDVVRVEREASVSARKGITVWPSGKLWSAGTLFSITNRPPERRCAAAF
jgi:hypothetical protein